MFVIKSLDDIKSFISISTTPKHTVPRIKIYIGLKVIRILFSLSIFIYVLTNPSSRAGCDTGSILLAGFNRFEYSLPSPRPVAIPRLKSPVYNLPIAGGRIVECILFPRVLALFEIKNLRTGFELKSPCLLRTTITISA